MTRANSGFRELQTHDASRSRRRPRARRARARNRARCNDRRDSARAHDVSGLIGVPADLDVLAPASRARRRNARAAAARLAAARSRPEAARPRDAPASGPRRSRSRGYIRGSSRPRPPPRGARVPGRRAGREGSCPTSPRLPPGGVCRWPKRITVSPRGEDRFRGLVSIAVGHAGAINANRAVGAIRDRHVHGPIERVFLRRARDALDNG